jgi:hypothetical protein
VRLFTKQIFSLEPAETHERFDAAVGNLFFSCRRLSGGVLWNT